MIGVVIPVHNEEDHLRACLCSVQLAAQYSALQREEVRVTVVLDACDDGSADIAKAMQVDSLAIHARNVGRARAAGASRLLAAGARWLAFTDADSIVSEGWLAMQLSLDADVVCGTVDVNDWAYHGEQGAILRRRFYASYCDHDQHRHVHGANFGVAAEAYRQAGGFPALPCGEDVALVQALMDSGARISWSAAPRVTTSSRFVSRAHGGFGTTLQTLATASIAATA